MNDNWYTIGIHSRHLVNTLQSYRTDTQKIHNGHLVDQPMLTIIRHDYPFGIQELVSQGRVVDLALFPGEWKWLYISEPCGYTLLSGHWL